MEIMYKYVFIIIFIRKISKENQNIFFLILSTFKILYYTSSQRGLLFFLALEYGKE